MKKKVYQEPAIVIAEMSPLYSILNVSPPNTKSTNGEDFEWEDE